MNSRSAPLDWENPDWDSGGHVHNWKRYASDWLKEVWLEMTREHRRAVAATLDDIAGCEEWD